MSFSFGFDGEDYSEDEEELNKTAQALSIENCRHDEKTSAALLPAMRHDIEDLLNTLPMTLSYSMLELSGTKLPRRALWDIKHQLMAGPDFVNDVNENEDNKQDEDESDHVLRMMEHDDVISGEYEGGFKTWECSLDLVQHLASETSILSDTGSVLELGCGSALPSLQAFSAALRAGRGLRLIVQDYNLQVLQYSTVPNIFLAWYALQDNDKDDHDDSEEIEVTEALKASFLVAMQASRINIECYSGAWSTTLTQEIGRVDLILAAETIYETRNLPAFTRTLQECLMPQKGTALVAAKTIYFGVGGGVEEFSKGLKQHELTWSQVFKSNAGVKRTIMAVKHK